MSNLHSVKGIDAIKALEHAGFSVVRIKGSHHVMKKSGHPNVLSIPVHGNSTVAEGTLRSIIKKAGLTMDEFISLLQ